ncbi:MAG: hypothetical protein U0V02_09455 [Anaerolineales bacterium]
MYIDPNTGGMLFQVLAVVFAVFSGVFLVFSSKIRAGIAKLRRRNKEDQSNQEETK